MQVVLFDVKTNNVDSNYLCIWFDMKLDFDNDYIVAVVVFMIFLIFCKQIFECMSSFCSCSEQCFKTCSQITCPCLQHDQEQCMRMTCMSALVIFSFLQPLFFVCAHTYMRNECAWTSVIFDFDIVKHNASLPAQVNGEISTDAPNVNVLVKSYEVDNVLMLTPFSLSLTSSTWAWLSLKQNNVFQSDPLWDDSLFEETRSLWVYEFVYYFEVFCLVLNMLVISMQPVSLNLVVMMSLLLSLVCFVFFKVGRTGVSNDSEQMQMFVLFALVCTLLSVKVGINVHSSIVSLILGVMIMVLLPCFLLQYMRMQAEWKAGSVILMRTLYSNLHAFVFLILLLAGGNCIDVSTVTRM